ncbi:MAG: ABC transporter permease [Anaerolineales bacterium]|nr:MAG: ABC transporter permease [Anaerolineales bacterium]
MTRYIIRRLLQAIPLLIIISAIIFLLINAMGDPLASFGGRRRIRSQDRERLTRQLGLDKPILVQYVVWLFGNDWMKIDMDGDGIPETPGKRKGVLRGDFGKSLMGRRPVLEVIGERIPNTLLLMLTTEIVVWILALGIGIYSALRQYSTLDNVITAFSFIGFSMPVFWLALLLMFIFAVSFKRWGLPYFPTVGMYDLEVGKTVLQVAWHMVLPVTTMSIISVAGYSRYVRSQMLEVISQDYIRTAYAKGLPQRMVLLGHALKNAALPLVTIEGMSLPLLIGGAVVTETIFAWPGMGRLYIEAASDTDIPVLMGILMIISTLVVVFQIITDITYTFLDPRIRYD